MRQALAVAVQLAHWHFDVATGYGLLDHLRSLAACAIIGTHTTLLLERAVIN